MDDRNHTSIRRFFGAIAFSLVILSVKVEIKEFSIIDAVKTLFFNFWYLFTISIWVGLAGMLCTDTYNYLKKNSITNELIR